MSQKVTSIEINAWNDLVCTQLVCNLGQYWHMAHGSVY